MVYKLEFPTRRDSAVHLFRTNGPSLSRDKGTTGKLKILPWAGTVCQIPGRDTRRDSLDYRGINAMEKQISACCIRGMMKNDGSGSVSLCPEGLKIIRCHFLGADPPF